MVRGGQLTQIRLVVSLRVIDLGGKMPRVRVYSSEFMVKQSVYAL